MKPSVHKRLWPLLMLALAMTACQAGREKEGAMVSIQEARYWSNAAHEALPLSLSIVPTGTARLWIRSNRDRPERSILGYFEGPCLASSVESALVAVGSSEFERLSNPESVKPGEVVRKITVTRSIDSTLTRFVAEGAPAPTAFERTESAFFTLTQDAMKHPLIALGLRADSMPAQVASGEEIRFQLRLSNPGRQSLRIATPKAWRDAGTEFSAQGLRTDIPIAQLTNSHSPSTPIGPHDITVAAPTSADDFMVLEPGDSLALPVRLRLAWEPGSWGQLTPSTSGRAESSSAT